MTEHSRTPAENAEQLEEGDEFQWIGEGWTDDGPRPPNRATVLDRYRDRDHEGEDAEVIEIEGIQGGKAEIYLYEDRDEVILYGSAEKPEQVLEIRQDTR